MQKKFSVEGMNVSVVKFNDDTTHDTLPPKVYTVEFSQFRGFYLSIQSNRFSVPERIYGNMQSRIDKCLKTYLSRPGSTGILFTGDKGTGKSLQMSLVANEALDRFKMPIIVVKHPFTDDGFVNFIEDLGECCIVFDEFGKMYPTGTRSSENNANQAILLSLFDGVHKTKRLFLLTENETYNISSFMLNRPSRVYYHFKYGKLDEESIKGYCADHYVPSNIVNDIVDLCRRARIFSFDILQTIVQEFTRFGESIENTIKDLNIDLISDDIKSYRIVKVYDKRLNTTRKLFNNNTLTNIDSFYVYLKKLKEEDIPEEQKAQFITEGYDFDPDDMYDAFRVNATDRAYQKGNQTLYDCDEEGFKVIIEELPPRVVSYRDAF